jgi:membrane-bound inhibitor of C-type lysozyme
MRKLLLVFIVLGVFSCKSEEVLPIANSDVFILTKKMDGVIMYGLGLHTYANVQMSAVTAEDETGEVYVLKAYNNYTYEYYIETDAGDFSTTLPETGSYTFSVTLTDDQVLTVSNGLLGSYIDPVEFTTCEYDADNNRIDVAWDSSSEEDYSVLILRNSDGTMVYYSSSISSSTTSAKITTSGWVSGYSPVAGDTYTVELGMYQKESDSDILIEAKAITSQEVIWGN